MILSNFTAYKGQHCETTATGTLLMQLGIDFSEPMLFGLGEGLGFIFWNMKSMDFPFIGGRVKPDLLTENLCRNLGLELEVIETSSKKKAWNYVVDKLNQNKAVGLKLDCYHLDYFSTKVHFAGHYVAMYGYDDTDAYLVDTKQQGHQVKTSLQNLELARSEKGPMSSRNKSYTISQNGKLKDLDAAIPIAILNNTQEYLNPPIKNLTYKGILKTSVEIEKWFNRSKDIQGDFQTTAMLMERAGTGGSLFRNLYRDFLQESFDLLQISALKVAADDFTQIALLWKEVADLFDQAGESEDIQYIHQASEILKDLSEREKKSMEGLRQAFAC